MMVSVSIEAKTARSTCAVLVDAAPDAVAVAVVVGAAAAETVKAQRMAERTSFILSAAMKNEE